MVCRTGHAGALLTHSDRGENKAPLEALAFSPEELPLETKLVLQENSSSGEEDGSSEEADSVSGEVDSSSGEQPSSL